MDALNGALVKSQDTGQLEQGEGYSRDKMLAFLKRYAPPERAAVGSPLWPLALGALALG